MRTLKLCNFIRDDAEKALITGELQDFESDCLFVLPDSFVRCAGAVVVAVPISADIDV